jgi:hypothetical protein
MSPTFWLTIRVGGKRIPLPLLLILPLALVAEILALLPVVIYAIWRKQTLPLKLVSRFCLSRLMLVLILHGGKFNISVCDGPDRVRVGGRRKI